METAEGMTTGPPPRDGRAAVGERGRPSNGGDLGFTYSIYRFYDTEDRLLYLGRSERVRQRIIDLEIGRPRNLPLGHDDGPKPWWREAARIELQHLPPGTTDEEARAEERRQIEAFRPVYNQEHNEVFFDRSRLEQAMDVAHFEVDVATAEHDRHGGTVRPLADIIVDSNRAADRLRPSGAKRLREGFRRPVVADSDQPSRPAAQSRHRQQASARTEGPGSLAGLIIVLLILVALVVAAIVVSARVVF